MALYRNSHTICKTVANSWRLASKPISATCNSSCRSYYNEDNDDGSLFNFFKRSFVSSTPHLKFSSHDNPAPSDTTLPPLHGGPSYMRAAVFWEPNKPLTFEDFNMPRPKANEILIKTKACGVCHSDLHVMKGELPFSSPCVVGHEITGEVVEHGALTDSKIIERFKI